MSTKKRIAAILLIVFALTLSACVQKAPANSNSGQSKQQTETQNNATNDGTITEEAAKKIVLDKLPGSTEADFYSFKKELDDGVWKYEGKISNNGQIYEFEIDAVSGNILEWDIDD